MRTNTSLLPALLLASAVATVPRPATAAAWQVGRCHMDVCSWFSVADRTTVETTASGRLVLAAVLGCTSQHKNGAYPKRYACPKPVAALHAAFCSTAAPSIAWKEDGKWQRTKLIVGDAGVFGFTLSALAHYLAICHDLRWNGEPLGPIAAKLGYAKSALESPAQDEVGKLLELAER